MTRGKYDAPECIERYVAFKVAAATRQSESTAVTEARKKFYDVQTHKTELETARIQRETIPANDYVTDMFALQQIFGDALDSIDNTLATDISEMDDATAISDRLTLATHAIRESVADSIVAYAGTVEG